MPTKGMKKAAAKAKSGAMKRAKPKADITQKKNTKKDTKAKPSKGKLDDDESDDECAICYMSTGKLVKVPCCG